MSRETWRPIEGLPGYEVSSLGQVRSWRAPFGRGRRSEPLVLKPRTNHKGYLRVNLGGRTRKVHRLVLEAFVGPCPEGHVADHRNRDRSDARAANLRWVTPAENNQHLRKLAPGQVVELRRLYAAGEMNLRELAQVFRIDHTTVSAIVRGETYREIPLAAA